MKLKDYTATKRRELVRDAATRALTGSGLVLGTRVLADLIAATLETDEAALIGRTLMDLAPTFPGAAQLDGTFKRFGQTMRPWSWAAESAAPLRNEVAPLRNEARADENWLDIPAELGQKEGQE